MSARHSLLLHLLLLLWYLFALHCDMKLTSDGRLLGTATYGGRWKYLTFINMILQTTYFGVCVFADLLWLLPQRDKRVQRLCLRVSALRDWLFAALAFPIGFFVVVSFWVLYVYDRELVYPKILDQIIPMWLNHAMHSVVLLLLMLELVFVQHSWPSHKGGIAVLITFCCSYLIWVLWIHYRAAIWVYPILEVLSPVGTAVFLTAAVMVTIALYAVGMKLHHWRWGLLDRNGNESFCINQEQVQESQPELANNAGTQKLSDPDIPVCSDPPPPPITPSVSLSPKKFPPHPDPFQQKLLDLQKEGFEHLAIKLDQVIDLMGNIAQCLSVLAQGQIQPAEPVVRSLSPTNVSLRADPTTLVQSKPAGVALGEPEMVTDAEKISNPKHTRLPLKSQLPSLRRTMKGSASVSSGVHIAPSVELRQAEPPFPSLDSVIN